MVLISGFHPAKFAGAHTRIAAKKPAEVGFIVKPQILSRFSHGESLVQHQLAHLVQLAAIDIFHQGLAGVFPKNIAEISFGKRRVGGRHSLSPRALLSGVGNRIALRTAKHRCIVM